MATFVSVCNRSSEQGRVARLPESKASPNLAPCVSMPRHGPGTPQSTGRMVNALPQTNAGRARALRRVAHGGPRGATAALGNPGDTLCSLWAIRLDVDLVGDDLYRLADPSSAAQRPAHGHFRRLSRGLLRCRLRLPFRHPSCVRVPQVPGPMPKVQTRDRGFRQALQLVVLQGSVDCACTNGARHDLSAVRCNVGMTM